MLSAILLMFILQDIQIRGVNRDQNKIQKANQFPNSRHFFTYRHSLRVSFRCTYAYVPVSSVFCGAVIPVVSQSIFGSWLLDNMTEYLVHCIAFYCTVQAVTKEIGKFYMKEQIMNWNQWCSSVNPKYWFFCAELCINFISSTPG